MNYYDPFKDRLRNGPAVAADLNWAMQEAGSLLLAASVALARHGRRTEGGRLVELVGAVEAVRTRSPEKKVAFADALEVLREIRSHRGEGGSGGEGSTCDCVNISDCEAAIDQLLAGAIAKATGEGQ